MITVNTDFVVKKIQARMAKAKPGSPEMLGALTRIGVVLTAQMIINARKNRLIDTGNLINSIRYELFKDGSNAGVKIGSFGVPYAAVHEFGFNGTVTVPNHTRRITRGDNPRSIAVRSHSRVMNIDKQPYIFPAVRKHRAFVVDTIKKALGE